MSASRLGVLAVGFALCSCTTLQPENIALDGAVWTISREDVRVAMAVARAGDAKHRTGRIYEVWVRNRNHLQIFFTENIPGYVEYAVVERVAGKWRYMGTQTEITTACLSHVGLTRRCS
jgi:hypothetical protein